MEELWKLKIRFIYNLHRGYVNARDKYKDVKQDFFLSFHCEIHTRLKQFSNYCRILQLESFLKVRLFEMNGPSNVLTLSQLQGGPAVIQLQTTESVSAMLNQVHVVISEITDSRTQHLHNIKHSPRYTFCLFSLFRVRCVCFP